MDQDRSLRSSGTHTRWQLVSNDASGPPTLVDMGASFTIAPGGVLTLFIAASPNAGSVWVRVVDEVSAAVFEQEITTDLPASNQFPGAAPLYEQRRHGCRCRLRLLRITIDELKPDDYLSIPSITAPDGSKQAVAISVFPAVLHGVGEGESPWDLGEGSLMTNAAFATMQAQGADHTIVVSAA
jgi:hypothetical protein